MSKEHEQGGVEGEPSAVEDVQRQEAVEEQAPTQPEQDQNDFDRELHASIFGDDVVDRIYSEEESGQEGEESGEVVEEVEEPAPAKSDTPPPPSSLLKPRRLRPVTEGSGVRRDPPPPADAAPSQPQEAEGWVEGLDPEVRREYEIARAAEVHFPDRFKGAAAKMERYLRLLESKRESGELPEPDDPDFEEQMRALRDRHAPRITQDDRIDIRAAEIADRRLKESDLQTQKRLEEYETKIRRLETAPLIDKAVDEFRKELVDSSDGAFLPEDVNEIEGMGYDQAYAKRPEETFPYIKAMILGRAFSEIRADSSILQKAPQRAHDDVMKIAVAESHRFNDTADKSELERDGRTFLPFDDYHRHRARLIQKFGNERDADAELTRSHFTFGEKEIYKAIMATCSREKKAYDDRMRKRYGGSPVSGKQAAVGVGSEDLKPTPPKKGPSRVRSDSVEDAAWEKVDDPWMASLVGDKIPARQA